MSMEVIDIYNPMRIFAVYVILKRCPRVVLVIKLEFDESSLC